MEYTIKDALLSENGAEIEVRGLLASLEEGLTKTGKPFVNGSIFANGDTMPIKVWDIGVEKFVSDHKLKIGAAVLLHGAININPQNGEKQLVLRDSQECPALTVLGKDEAEELSNATQIPAAEMLKAVTDKFLPELNLPSKERPEIAELALMAIVDLETLAAAPYNCETHHYRGGYIEHIYNVVHRMLFPIGLPKGVNIDWGVIFISLLLYHNGWYRNNIFNPVTGLVEVKDEISPVLYGTEGAFCTSCAIKQIAAYAGNSLNDPRIINIEHCIKVLNERVAPATLEAQVLLSYVTEELRVETAIEATRGLPSGTRGLKRVNGAVRGYISLAPDTKAEE